MSRGDRIVARWLLASGIGAALLWAIIRPGLQTENALQDASIVTGYALLTILVILVLSSFRKRLVVIPLGSGRTWMTIHVVGGLGALLLYTVHIDGLWPAAGYERWLAGLLLAVTASGLFGFAIQRLFPQRLNETGEEILYERIPRAIAEIRQSAEQLLLDSAVEARSGILGEHYMESLGWFFQRPRFIASHLLGGRRAQHWLELQFDIVERYLDGAETVHSAKLRALADKKLMIDFHYAAQRLMKVWLLLHVPLSAALVLMGFWHLLLVNIYAL